MYNKILEHLKNKKIAIVGFGREGKSTYKYIRKYLNNQEQSENNAKYIS